METKKDFLRFFWEDIDLIYNNNHKEGIGLRELLEIILKYQEQLKGKKVEFENMSPYTFQLTSTFKKVVLDENRLQVMVNWHNRRKRVETELDLESLDILVDMQHVIFQDRREYHSQKIIIFLKNA